MTRTVVLAIGLTVSVLAAIFLSTKTLASPPGVDGTITAVDAADQRISVMDVETEYWFQCTRNTKITVNGYAATFNQLEPGQRAKGAYDPSNFEALQVGTMPR